MRQRSMSTSCEGKKEVQLEAVGATKVERSEQAIILESVNDKAVI